MKMFSTVGSDRRPLITRVRHELKYRTLTVESIIRLTPGMLRISFSGPDLVDFVSLAPDDHMKIVVPSEPGKSERRDYTPRRFDRDVRLLEIDFALHDAGPATRWALDAKPGDLLEVGGPRGSAVIDPSVNRWLLIGDETALPAIGRRIEESPAGVRIVALVAVAGAAEHQTFETAADLTIHWAHRPLSAADDPEHLLSTLAVISLDHETFVWVAAEATVARSVRTYLVEERGHPLNRIKAAGYWVIGKADAHEKID